MAGRKKKKANNNDEVINLVSWDENIPVPNVQEVPKAKGKIQPLVDLPPEIPKVDCWICPKPFQLFRHIDKAIIVPVAKFYGIDDPNNALNIFNISDKRCYNKEDMREHTCRYLNYFNHFYDPEGELYMMYAKIKYMIDMVEEYDKEAFIHDIKKYILFNRSILLKVYLMDRNNYKIELKAKKGRSIPSLQYTNEHGHILMQMSILMNMMIPLVTHFAHSRDIEPIDEILLEVFNIILYMSDTDIFSKFYETASSETGRSQKLHKVLWDMQSIRGINGVTHSYDSIVNIILNIMPKYVFIENTVSFNCSAIRNSTTFKITGISYEFSFTKLSSSNRDSDCQSDFDKYESYLIRQDESLFLQNAVNAEQTLLMIEDRFGPFSQKEINYYIQRLEEGDTSPFNKFQKEMIFNLFAKYFGDPKSIKSINLIGYVKLMMAAKRMLTMSGMAVLPYVISSKVLKMPNKKAISKKYTNMIEADQLWKEIEKIYNGDERIKEDIMNKIGIAISSEYKIISPDEPEFDGRTIDYNCALLIAKEYMEFICMI